MRYVRSARTIVRTASAAFSGFHRKRLEVDELSDYMRRDLGLIDGRSRYDSGFAQSDGRPMRLDLLTITRYAL